MGFDYRPYQIAAATSCSLTLAQKDSAIAVLPTGAGKTEVMVIVARQWTADHPESSVLILSHLSLLTDQTFDRFKARAPLLSTGKLQGQLRPGMLSRVTVSTMQTTRLATHAKDLQETLLYPVGLIIVDEAHHFPTASYQKIRQFFPAAKVLGFTATPYKDRRVMTSAFDAIAYSISLQELINGGILLPPVLKQIPSKNDDPAATIAETVTLYRQLELGRKAICYMRSIDDAKALRNAFESQGVRARAVTSELTGDPRTAVLEGFLGKATDVLTTVDVLTAGFDAPPVEAIFMPYGTKSPTQYLQRIGRGLRTHPGKTDCRVYLFGAPPSIAKRVWETQHYNVLNAGSSADRAFPTIAEDMTHKLYESSSEIYTWNNLVLDAMDRMKKLGMTELADMLNHRDFPKRFLGDIQALIARLPQQKTLMPGGKLPASEPQKDYLFRAGFTSTQVDRLTRNEASMMIATVKADQGRTCQPPREFILPEGRYKGRAVWETPHAYRSSVKKRQPDSPVARTITEWEKRQA